MSATVPSKQRAHRILKGLSCFLPPELRLGKPLPRGVTLSPDEEILGGIWGSRLESILTDRGAYFRVALGWRFVSYGEIEDVSFPDKGSPDGSLSLRTPIGNIELLAGRSEL